MVRFMIYLLETGICLSLLYLAYWLFLRKETYFNFNRLFLVGSILLALAVPVLHLSINIQLGSSLERPARGVLKFRQGYGELIRYIDARGIVRMEAIVQVEWMKGDQFPTGPDMEIEQLQAMSHSIQELSVQDQIFQSQEFSLLYI